MKKDLLSNGMPKGIGTYIIGFAIEIAVTLLAMLFFALIMYFSGATGKYAAVFATVSVAIGSFLASFWTARKNETKGWRTGLIIGLLTFILVTLISLVINDSGVSVNTLFHFIIIMLSSFIGGVMGVNKQKHKYI